MATRLAKPQPKSGTPVGMHAWAQLLQDAIKRAEKANDPRVAGLRKALGTGQEERVLRRMGVISTKDLEREFPEP